MQSSFDIGKMELSDELQTNVSIEMITIVTVKSKCQFCFAFFNDPRKSEEHSDQCEFRFTETFVAIDGRVKFACPVCFDVFQTRAECTSHEQMHKFPGGFPCSFCGEIFLNDFECDQHMETIHETFKCFMCENEVEFGTEQSLINHMECAHSKNGRYTFCTDCDANFERKTQLRLHNETNCGQYRIWNCFECSPRLLSESAFKEHMEIHETNCMYKIEPEEYGPTFPKLEVVSIDMASECEPMPCNSLDAIDSAATNADFDKCEYFDDDQNIEYLDDENPIDGSDGKMDASGDEAASYRVIKNEEVASNKSNRTRSQRKKEKILYESKQCGTKFPEKKSSRAANLKSNCEKSEKCIYCGMMFHTKRKLNEHKETRHAAEFHKCEICGESYKRIWVHLRRHTYRKSFACDYCDRVFSYRTSLLKHLSVHTGIKPYECRSCNQRFLNSMDLQSHRISCNHLPISGSSGSKSDTQDEDAENDPIAIKINVPKNTTLMDKNFACQYCNMKYTREIYLLKHIVVHGPDGRLLHRCECCQTYFATKDERKKHKKKEHNEELKCKICNKMFSFLDALQNHSRSMHSNEIRKKHMCIKCGKSFVNKLTLDSHEESDCGRLPNYKCDECGKILSNKYTLQTHQRKHTDERSFLCKTCGKMFHSKSTLLIHVRIHTGERPYKCSYCEKGFMDRNSLNLHTSVHTGFKRYICRGCGARFSCNSNLRAHRRVRKNTCGLLPLTSDALIKENTS